MLRTLGQAGPIPPTRSDRPTDEVNTPARHVTRPGETLDMRQPPIRTRLTALALDRWLTHIGLNRSQCADRRVPLNPGTLPSDTGMADLCGRDNKYLPNK